MKFELQSGTQMHYPPTRMIKYDTRKQKI